MDDMELLLVRIDHFHDRKKYISVLREWLKELQIVNGRIISLGVDVQLLFVAASEVQNSNLLQFYKLRDIDTNSRGERCVDKFIDVLGRKKVPTSSSCKGFMEMNVLSPKLLQKVLVHEWKAEQEWLDTVLATKRTKAFLEWKETAKAARKERRKREGLEKQQEREAKKRRKEKEAVQTEQVEAARAEEKEASGNEKEDKVMKSVEVRKQQTTSTPQKQLKQKQEQQPLAQKKKKKNKKP
ncbi:hypothetical protein KXD40_008267 [Peronospora effusa]|uniref:RWD domain-containing protein 3 n=1 Tax=Peronospora effusa TaxID=542832 RepID=A0A3M6V9L4_9STRA|nr:hypothetical protein DD238_008016 [Peronospora effusa]RQM13790.1 hypothetical protein DD237_005306 [Peronospora effusa]UIZ24050.1 hypothetical protein KXD40_008267 [Peronospora effusa]CAI5707737.1 unnamed protein product [Peronospora effusa]